MPHKVRNGEVVRVFPQHTALEHMGEHVAELAVHFSAHDLKRLELYARNMVDHHMVTDLLPTLGGFLTDKAALHMGRFERFVRELARYERAFEESQKYKEGKFVLERAKLSQHGRKAVVATPREEAQLSADEDDDD